MITYINKKKNLTSQSKDNALLTTLVLKLTIFPSLYKVEVRTLCKKFSFYPWFHKNIDLLMIFQPPAGIRYTLKIKAIIDKMESNIGIALKKTGEVI